MVTSAGRPSGIDGHPQPSMFSYRVILTHFASDAHYAYQDAGTLEKALAACETTSPWNTEKAEEWWRRHGGETALPSSQKAEQQKRSEVRIQKFLTSDF